MGNILNRYSPADYQVEKVIGKRKATGELKLKRLKGIHRKMITMHLRGLSNRDIEAVTGYSEIAISRILRDPLSQAYIQEYLAGVEVELQGMQVLAADALREGLVSADQSIALRAVDTYFKATGRYAKAEEGKGTAEDAIARALAAIAENQSEAINTLSRGNTAKVISMPTSGRVIDVETEDGSNPSRGGVPKSGGTLIPMARNDRSGHGGASD